MSAIQPVDSAFTGGTMELIPLSGDIPPQNVPAAEGEASIHGSPVISAVIMVSILLCIASARTFVNMLPTLAGCFFRWKESLNIENSLMLNIGRNRLFLVLIIPFCLIVSGYRLYDPGAVSSLPQPFHFMAVTGAMLLYLALKDILSLALRSSRMNEKAYKAAVHTFRTFFVVVTSAMLVTAGALEIFSASGSLAKHVLIYETALIYTVCMVREAQIFKNTRSVFSAILYLCALEILPTGILVATAIVL